MKVFFNASHRGQEEFLRHYNAIYNEIKRLGYIHLNHDVIKLTAKDFYNSLIKGGRSADVSFYKTRMQFISEADICVYDCSSPSLSIGFLIDKSLEQGKPTIALYCKDKGKNTTPYLIDGIENERLIVRGYTDRNVKKVLRDALEQAKERRDKRFNFFISPKLLEYLEKVSRAEGITKSKFIRNLILEHMRKVAS